MIQPRPRHARSFTITIACFGLFASACAAHKSSDAPAATPAEKAEGAADVSQAPPFAAEPSTIDEASAELDRTERDVLTMLGPSAGTSPTLPAPTQPGAEALAEGRCVDVCRALASMGRARDHVCKLAGPEVERCTTANERVDRARARAAASCPACS